MQTPAGARFDMFLPFLITYGTIIFSLSSLAVIAHWNVPKFRDWFAQPINKFWLVWIILVVCSGGMVSARLCVPPTSQGRAPRMRLAASRASC